MNYTGNPEDPIFKGPKGGHLSRSTFQRLLQTRLASAVTAYIPNSATIQIAAYTGISFRKGGITALTRAAAAHRLLMSQVADFADHKDIQTTRRYDEPTAVDRAGFSKIIGQAIADYVNQN